MDDILQGMRIFEEDKKLNKQIGFLKTSWAYAYPDINIRREIGWAHAWLMSNPKRMKKDLARFLNNWLKSSQRTALSPIKAPQRLAPAPRYEVPEEDICTPSMFADLRSQLKRR